MVLPVDRSDDLPFAQQMAAGGDDPVVGIDARQHGRSVGGERTEPHRREVDLLRRRIDHPQRRGIAGTAPVLSGVDADDWIVAAGGHLLREGQTVAPVDRQNRPVLKRRAANTAKAR